MKPKAPSTPYGYTVFCDDIRQEVGGKYSYIGIYRAKIILQGTFPAALPKFCFAVNLVLRPKDIRKLKDSIIIKIFPPGPEDVEPMLTAEIPHEKLAEAPMPDSEDPLLTITFNAMATPLELKEEGRIRVRAFCGANEWKLGSIDVRAHTKQPAGTDIPSEEPH
jgi:hypothetical protein